MQQEYRTIADEYVHAASDFFGDRLVSICFFGSVARGEATADSDIDVLVVATELPKDVGLRFRETAGIHETLRRSSEYRKLRQQGRSAFISDLFLSPDEAHAHPPILLDLTDDAFIAYDRNGFLKGVLEDMKQRLRDLGARKVKARKGHYWILKPNTRPDEVIEI
ncbi:MAG TPA: nucleotidyltransferase domain-containing protein [Candidatus Dormibacteraeota bacterium]|nr:nucleotidyltransferase domain-containing protein [Candidatus Dormibacteraeota bacterium]